MCLDFSAMLIKLIAAIDTSRSPLESTCNPKSSLYHLLYSVKTRSLSVQVLSNPHIVYLIPLFILYILLAIHVESFTFQLPGADAEIPVGGGGGGGLMYESHLLYTKHSMHFIALHIWFPHTIDSDNPGERLCHFLNRGLKFEVREIIWSLKFQDPNCAYYLKILGRQDYWGLIFLLTQKRILSLKILGGRNYFG